MSATGAMRKFDSSEPRRPDLCKPYKLPSSWNIGDAESGDIIGALLGSAS